MSTLYQYSPKQLFSWGFCDALRERKNGFKRRTVDQLPSGSEYEVYREAYNIGYTIELDTDKYNLHNGSRNIEMYWDQYCKDNPRILIQEDLYNNRFAGMI